MPTEFAAVAHSVKVEIDTTPNGVSRTWAIVRGVENMAEALNEAVTQKQFYEDHGFARNYVTGMAAAYTCTGSRILGDPAQDYIFNPARKFGLMAERNTNFRLSRGEADGTVSQITGAITFANITDVGGATTDLSPVSFEVRLNGKPTIARITPASTLTVTSVAGTAVGDTLLTVAEASAAGCKYVYDYGTVAPSATVGKILTGWNDFVSGVDYTIPSGDYVVVAMVNLSTSQVVAVGQATVVVKS